MDIEKLAREAAQLSGDENLVGGEGSGFWIDIDPAADFIKHFAATVAEECAKLCEGPGMYHEYTIMGAEACAAAIRERFKA